MKKLLCLIISISMLLTMSTTAFAASDLSPTTDADGYTVAGVAPVAKVDGSIYDNAITVSFDIDELLTHSTNVTRSGSSYSGSYTSAKYETGLPGYKYEISFDWVADVNSSGDYIFKNNAIQNPLITTYTNHVLLALTWSYYTYSFDKNTYGVATNGKSVTFETDYEFTVYEKETAISHNFVEENTKTIYINDLL
ncbi:MAG: hypothetical protein K6E30_00125 [Lachnospiraceae bacterium]|nr:hypothetical protein [Lachnospiraceae bacterium]